MPSSSAMPTAVATTRSRDSSALTFGLIRLRGKCAQTLGGRLGGNGSFLAAHFSLRSPKDWDEAIEAISPGAAVAWGLWPGTCPGREGGLPVRTAYGVRIRGTAPWA